MCVCQLGSLPVQLDGWSAQSVSQDTNVRAETGHPQHDDSSPDSAERASSGTALSDVVEEGSALSDASSSSASLAPLRTLRHKSSSSLPRSPTQVHILAFAGTTFFPYILHIGVTRNTGVVKLHSQDPHLRLMIALQT